VLNKEEMDKKCANHFLARRAALQGKEASLKALETVEDPLEATFHSVRVEGWDVLAQARDDALYLMSHLY
jgi:hypothetical protein